VQRIGRLFNRVVGNRLVSDSSFMFAANLISTGTSMLSSLVLIRVLGAEQMGLIVIATTLIAALVDFMDVRTPEALIKFMGGALAQGRPREALAYLYIGVGVDAAMMLLTVIVLLLALPAALTIYPADVEPLARIYLWSVPFEMLATSASALLYVFKRFRLHGWIRIVHSLIALIVLVALALHGREAVVWGYVINLGIGFAFWLIAALWLLRTQFESLRGAAYRSAWRDFLPFAFHTSMMASMKAVSGNIDVLLIGALRPAADAAFLRIARSGASLMTLPIAPLTSVLYPLINEAWARQQIAEVKRLIRQYTLITGAIVGAALLVVWIAGDFAVSLLYGVENLPIADVLKILVIGMALESLAGWMRLTTMAHGQPGLVTFTGFAAMLLRIVAAVPLIYVFGAPGAAWAYVIGVLVSVGLNIVYTLPRVGLPLNRLLR
jgi:O-antigen/teichoic acid export membrane protein